MTHRLGSPTGPATGTGRRASALAALRAPVLRPTRPALGPLAPHERVILRDARLDARVLTDVLGTAVPADLLRTPVQRARALAPLVPPGAVVGGEAALWVHAGGRPPSRLALIIPSRRGRGPGTVVYRGTVPACDIVTLDGLRCLGPARAVADLARTAAPARAALAVLTARALGLGSTELHLALARCRGAACRGRPRARRLIDALVASAQP
ncbi:MULTISPECIES: hypothetical protein [unclassified Actinomyces]|uniref:hypothetical protein n=1 Tax=unclassified Actinomyces TaxID=2609248 RepID=UPI002016D019|nr:MULTISPECIES: hypothetical protein [unclassified Actinomyces]MCL3778341.1 hypothetical protein [Actinomyces sp. AC-20-1]MCL3790212.1 hypothetical protein [Actinomyces sp. 187325]MCL3792477.1 hypothetical protein [Actinomyces sp. 186855]MCL3794313.1 hypothetical protein [Actinomyces sp. 217892]